MKKLWNWGVGIATVYAIFAGATLGFVVFAMQQPVDLVSPEYYAQAQAHQVRQLAAERALALGEAMRIEVDRAAQTMTVTWPAGARPESGEVRFYRPSDSRADKREPIRVNDDGRQIVSLAALAAGNWLVQCEWTSGQALYYLERHIVVP